MDGVTLALGEDVSKLNGLVAGTPVAVQIEDGWWAYRATGGDMLTPVGDASHMTADGALAEVRP